MIFGLLFFSFGLLHSHRPFLLSTSIMLKCLLEEVEELQGEAVVEQAARSSPTQEETC